MRERTLRVDIAKLKSLSQVYRPSKIAKTLNITKQRWHNYKVGRHDVPESIVDAICENYALDKTELVLAP
jgi:hypothetical protein